MIRLTVWVPVLAATAALVACQGVPVRTDQNAQLLASVHCQSVAWAGGFKGASPLRNTIANPLNEARLRDAIAANLQSAGLTLVNEPLSTPPLAGALGIERGADRRRDDSQACDDSQASGDSESSPHSLSSPKVSARCR